MKLIKLQAMLLALVLTLYASVSFADTASIVLNANTAAADEMAALPHMDGVLAEVIVSNRPFVTIGEMNHLLGSDLDEDELEALYGRLFVPIDLNNASRSDILLIPGVGGRMAHEFEEYRPYSNIEQFRREMGKYVDEEEVARLEQYVTLD
jgi:DNA uptake protein ComE-like DNA-binding protein